MLTKIETFTKELTYNDESAAGEAEGNASSIKKK